MSKYADIIAKLEKATRPSEELDANIRCALLAPEGSYVRQSEINGAWCIYFGERGGRPSLFEPDRLRHVPHDLWRGAYTASIDAAIALVEAKLPGCEYTMGKNVSEGFSAKCNYVNASDKWVFASSGVARPNLAIALLVSMFRALEDNA